MMEMSKEDKTSQGRRRDSFEDFVASQSPTLSSQESLPSLLSSLNGNTGYYKNITDSSIATIHRNNLNFLSEQNDQQQQSHVHFSDRRISPNNGFSSPPPSPIVSELLRSFTSSSTSFDCSGLFSTSLDSILDQYELENGLEPLQVQESTKFDALARLIKERNPYCEQFAEILRGNSEISNIPSLPSLGILCLSDEPPNFPTTTRDLQDEDNNDNFTKESLSNNNNECNESMAQQQISNSSVTSIISQYLSPAAPLTQEAKINKEKSQEVSLRKPTVDLSEDNRDSKNVERGTRLCKPTRINTEVKEFFAKARTSGNFEVATVTPQQPPQHIDNSRDALRETALNECKGISKDRLKTSIPIPIPKTSPPCSSSSSGKGGKLVSAGSEITVDTSGGRVLGRNRSSKSKIPVPLPKTKSKSVKEAGEGMKISCTSSAKSSQICNNITRGDSGGRVAATASDNLAQQVENRDGKAEVGNEMSLKEKQTSGISSLDRESGIDQLESNLEKREEDAKKIPCSLPKRRNIGEGDEVSVALGLIDGLSGHTTWIMKKLLEFPPTDKDALEKLEKLNECPDIGEFFGVPYMTRQVREHLFFGGGKLPKPS